MITSCGDKCESKVFEVTRGIFVSKKTEVRLWHNLIQLHKKELCYLCRMCILRPWLKVPLMMGVVTIEVSHYVSTIVYFSDLCQSAQCTSCQDYKTKVCVNSVARLLEGNIGVYAEGGSIAA